MSLVPFVTRSSWEMKRPPTLKGVDGHAAWRRIETELETQTLFIINTIGSSTTREPPRSTLVASIEDMLDVVSGLDQRLVRSVYLLYCSDADKTLSLHRIASVEMGQGSREFRFPPLRCVFESGGAYGDVEAGTPGTFEVIRFPTGSAA